MKKSKIIHRPDIISIEELENLIKFYQNKKIALIGANDSQGVNANAAFFNDGMINTIRKVFSSYDVDTVTLDACTMYLNKMDNLYQILNSNIDPSKKQLKQLQVNSLVAALGDLGFVPPIIRPVLKQLGKLSAIIYRSKPNDENINLRETMKSSDETIFIYSSGINDLMRRLGNNPWALKKSYDDRFINYKYAYTVEQIKDPKNLYALEDGTKRNFEKIQHIRKDIDIMALGIYGPRSIQEIEFARFVDFVNRYNEILLKICKEFGVTYVDTTKIGSIYNKSDKNFHVDYEGHIALANSIMKMLYERKINGIINTSDQTSNIDVPSLVDEEYYFPESKKQEYLDIRNEQIEHEIETENEIFRKSGIK